MTVASSPSIRPMGSSMQPRPFLGSIVIVATGKGGRVTPGG